VNPFTNVIQNFYYTNPAGYLVDILLPPGDYGSDNKFVDGDFTWHGTDILSVIPYFNTLYGNPYKLQLFFYNGLAYNYTDSTAQSSWTDTYSADTPQEWIDRSGSVSLFYTKFELLALSDICFPAGTPILTDFGNIPIDKIIPEIHTINKKPIINITKTITTDKYLICFEKDSLDKNYPNRRTVVSKNHKILYKNKMVEAHNFLHNFADVKKVKYDCGILYNVLMENYDKIKVNNLICETLDPKNIVAKLYTSKFSEDYKNNLVLMMNNSKINNNYSTHKKFSTNIYK
jgi:hypothetical protein